MATASKKTAAASKRTNSTKAAKTAKPDAAKASSRSLWKGAISFGLVHVPVALYSATAEHDVDFDWLDKRTLDPVGYKRYNKRTGKDVKKEDIVKGVKLAGGDEYVVLSDEEIRNAYPKRTRTIEIETFVNAADVSFVYLEKPYYLAPEAKAERVYALLREALEQSGVIGIARFVLHNKEHLAALIPTGPALMLGTMRWANEIRPAEGLDLPEEGATANRLKPAELKMAQQLIGEMTSKWKPADYQDDFTSAIHTLVAKKAKAGKTASVKPLEEAPEGETASNVVDLTELLRRSLGGKSKPAVKTAERPATKSKPAVKKKAA